MTLPLLQLIHPTQRETRDRLPAFQGLAFGIHGIAGSEQREVAIPICELGGHCVPDSIGLTMPVDYLVCMEASVETARESNEQCVPKEADFKYIRASWVYECRRVRGSSAEILLGR